MADVEELLNEGRVEEAIAALADAIEASDPPVARALLGGLLYADDDFTGARHQWEHAHVRFKELGQPRMAARIAACLAELHWSVLGNLAAARGWIRRAERLLTPEGRCVEQGYVALALVACEATDLLELEARADEALALAIEFDDTALQVRALADGGYALVAQGRAAEGFDRLDEAMATLTAGEVHDIGLAATSFCAMLSACDVAGAPQRAEEWTGLIAQLILDRFGGRPKLLHTHCRLAYGSVLCSMGQWSEGEAALVEAGGGGARSHRADAAIRLAHLRVLQGRLDDAEELLRLNEDRPGASLPLGLLHLARGEHDLAAAALQRGLDAVVGDRLREASLLAALVEVELARDIDRAAEVVDRLATVADRCDAPSLRAEALLAAGRVAAARAEPGKAASLLADAQQALGDGERPMLCGTIRFERARALAAADDAPAAISEARAALAVFERLGAQPHVDRTAALLRSLGAPGARPRASLDELTAREHDVLDLLRQGLTNAEIGGRLYISPKTVEHHVGRVLTKLGVRSRAEAAAVAASVGRGAT